MRNEYVFFYTSRNILAMFPDISIINTFLYDDKMHYLGRHNGSQYWAGIYKNGENMIVDINVCGSLEHKVILID